MKHIHDRKNNEESNYNVALNGVCVVIEQLFQRQEADPMAKTESSINATVIIDSYDVDLVENELQNEDELNQQKNKV